MSSRNWNALGLLAAFFGLFWLLWRHQYFFHDDAYISLRYAQNFADFGALEWNIGERVEGYSNFLHVILTAALLKLNVAPELAVRSINFLSAVALIIASSATAQRLAPTNGPARALTIMTIGFTPGVALWVLGGLETPLLAALIALGVYGLVGTIQTGRTGFAFLSGVAFSFAVITRMDSAVFIFGAGLSALILAPRSNLHRFKLALMITGLPGLMSLIHMGWRLYYYGLPFPLTFYAKTGTPLEVRFLFVQAFPTYAAFAIPAFVLAFLLALITIFSRLEDKVVAKALALPILLHTAYVFWSGGDHMPGARVLLPLVAPACLIVLCFIGREKLFAGLIATATFIVAAIQPAQKMDPAAFVGKQVGKHIAMKWPDNQVISLATAGSTPFTAPQNLYIDQLGLNDPMIAARKEFPMVTPFQFVPGHAKGDGAYILSREPDVIIIGPAQGTSIDNPWFLSDYELGTLNEFENCYTQKQAQLDIAIDDLIRFGSDKAPPTKFTWYQRICPKSEE